MNNRREQHQETNEYKEGYPLISALVVGAGYGLAELETLGVDELERRKWELICWQEVCSGIGAFYALDDKIAEIEGLIERKRQAVALNVS